MRDKMLIYIHVCELGTLSRTYLANNNLPLIMVKTNNSTLHMVYNIQQSVTQDSSNNHYQV